MISSAARLVSKIPVVKLGASDRPPPARAADHHLGIQGRQNGGPFGRGVRQRQTPADRAAIADRAIGKARRNPRHQPARRVGAAAIFDCGMRHASANSHRIGIVRNRTQLRQSADIDQQARRRDPQVHHRHQRLATSDHPRLAPVFCEQIDGLCQAARPDVINGRRFHASLPSPTKPSGLGPPSPTVRERSFEHTGSSPSPAPRERVLSGAKRVRATPR